MSHEHKNKFTWPLIPVGSNDETIKEIQKKRRELMKEAEAVCINYLTEQLNDESAESLPTVVEEAVKFLTTKKPRSEREKTGRKPRTTKSETVADFFRARLITEGEDNVDETQAFIALKMGRGEIASMLKRHNSDCVADDRLWIKFSVPEESDDGIYTLEGTGANPPVNWKGPVPGPKSEEVLDNM